LQTKEKQSAAKTQTYVPDVVAPGRRKEKQKNQLTCAMAMVQVSQCLILAMPLEQSTRNRKNN